MTFDHMVDQGEYLPPTRFDYWRDRMGELWFDLKQAIKPFGCMFVSRCPDCHKIDGVLWWNIGYQTTHVSCIPF